MYDRDQLFIDGKWTEPQSDSAITVTSPHSEAVIGRTVGAGPADVDRAVEAARGAFDSGPWPRMQPVVPGIGLAMEVGLAVPAGARHGAQ